VIALVLISLATLLAEKARRRDLATRNQEQAASCQERFRELAARCRAVYHPKQRAGYTSRAKRQATKTTRRAGKTHGGCRETMARCLEAANFRVTYCNETRAEAKRLAWRSDSRDGWRDLIEQLGLRVAKNRDDFDRNPKTDVYVNESELIIDFRNGSQLSIFAADRPEDADKFRGGDKHIVWVDEAQKFPSLEYFVDEVVVPLLAKPGDEAGELWLSGTPSKNLSGLFFEVTKEPEQGPRAPGWEVHEWSVTDNPRYGSTAEERWAATAGAVLEAKGWDINDPPPQFIREWLGKWTTGDALYVYAVHAKPPVVYALSRVNSEGFYDHTKAVADLPQLVTSEDGNQEPITWYFALGVDFGHSDPFAWVLWAFSPQVAEIYEMGSWKRSGLITDQMRVRLHRVYEQVAGALVTFRGDAGGAMAKSTLEGWREAMGLPIEDAEKHGKETWIDLFNGEIYAGRVLYRKDSALLAEQKELHWKVLGTGKRVEWKDRTNANGEKLGNDASDASLYAYRDMVARRLEFTGPPKTEAELDARRARRMIESMSRASEPADEYEQEGWS